MISLTRMPHGVASGRRQGRSRAFSAYQFKLGSRSDRDTPGSLKAWRVGPRRAVTGLHTARMDPDTYRGDADLPDPDVYWRRRVSVLTALLIVVAAVVWACTRMSDDAADAGPGSAAAGPSAHTASPAAGA